MLLKENATPTLDLEEADDEDEGDDIVATENIDGELMSLFDALNVINNYDDDVVLVTPDPETEPANEQILLIKAIVNKQLTNRKRTAVKL